MCFEAAAEIVGAVISSGASSATAKDVQEVSDDAAEVQQLTDSGTQIANDSQNEAEGVVNEAESEGDELANEAGEAADTVEATGEEAGGEIETLTDANEEAQNEITQNQEEIERKQEEREQIISQIAEISGSEPVVQTEQPDPEMTAAQTTVPADTAQGDGGGQTVQTAATVAPIEGGDNPETADLVARANELGAEINGLGAANASLGEQIAVNSEQIQTVQTGAIEVTAEQSQIIDQASAEIITLMGDTDAAVKEISSVLQGNIKQLDSETVQKLATEMVKAGIKGEKSGLLTAAAAELGVSAAVSYGSTAQQAAECTKGAAIEGGASAKTIASNTAGKLLEQQMQSYTNQVYSNLKESLPQEAQSYLGDVESLIASAQQTIQSSQFYTVPEDDGSYTEEDPGKKQNNTQQTSTAAA